MVGPTIVFAPEPAWILLKSGKTMRVWFDGFGIEDGAIQWTLLVHGAPNWTMQTSVPASAIGGIEDGLAGSMNVDTPPVFSTLNRAAWRLDEVDAHLPAEQQAETGADNE